MQFSTLQSSALTLLTLQMLQATSALPLSTRGFAGDISAPLLAGAKGGVTATNAADPGLATDAENAVKSVVSRGFAGDLSAPLLAGAKGGVTATNAADPSLATEAENAVKSVVARQLSGIAEAAGDVASLAKSAAGAGKGSQSVAKAQEKDVNTDQPAADGIEVETRQLTGIAEAAGDVASLAKSAVGAGKGTQSVAKAQEKDVNTDQPAADGIEVETRQLTGIAEAAGDVASLAKSAAGAGKGTQSVAKAQEKDANTDQPAADGIEVETR